MGSAYQESDNDPGDKPTGLSEKSPTQEEQVQGDIEASGAERYEGQVGRQTLGVVEQLKNGKSEIGTFCLEKFHQHMTYRQIRQTNITGKVDIVSHNVIFNKPQHPIADNYSFSSHPPYLKMYVESTQKCSEWQNPFFLNYL